MPQTSFREKTSIEIMLAHRQTPTCTDPRESQQRVYWETDWFLPIVPTISQSSENSSWHHVSQTQMEWVLHGLATDPFRVFWKTFKHHGLPTGRFLGNQTVGPNLRKHSLSQEILSWHLCKFSFPQKQTATLHPFSPMSTTGVSLKLSGYLGPKCSRDNWYQNWHNWQR